MVHLRAVRLRGFKTFARPTELIFAPGVTVVIGPNGSGKSNLADAVLWVLGEQSPGSLRGRTMEDVVFAGSGGRAASAVAEVSLVFDNGSGTLPFDGEELEVTRRLVRDTGSEYRLNGSPCRLLDIQDLVGALGLGREMHSVISQGKVEAFLNSSPEARRAMVEEAAGLGRFKKRRERAQAKLDRTAENLLRVADIEGEVKAALRPLRQQVAAAQRFAQATEEWAGASARWLLSSAAALRAARLGAEQSLESAQAALADVAGKMADLRRQRAAEEEQFSAVLAERERLSAGYHQARATADHLGGRSVLLRQRLARVEGELERAVRRREMALSEAASLSQRLAEVSAESVDDARLTRVSGWSAALRDALDVSVPDYRAAVATEDDLKDQVFELEAARSRAVQEREFLRKELEERDRLIAELTELTKDAGARLRRLEAEVVEADARIEAAKEAADQAATTMWEAVEARDGARSEAHVAGQREAELQERLSGAETRQAVLRDIVGRREGMPDGARRLLESDTRCRPLADALTVRPGYERALAAALGPLVQAVVAPAGCTVETVLQSEGVLEAVWEATGEAGVERVGEPPAGTRELWEFVTAPDRLMRSLRTLLPPTAVLVEGEELGAAPLGELRKGGGSWRVVSRSGEVLERGIHAARRREAAGEALLTARNELEAVSRERGSLLELITDAQETSRKAVVEVERTEQGLREAEAGLREAEKRLTAERGEADLCRRRIEEAQGQSSDLVSRLERERGLGRQIAADMQGLEESMAANEVELEGARGSLRALQSRLETLRATVGRLEEKKGQAALVEVKLRERCRAQAGERSRIQAQHAAAEKEVARWERRVGGLERYLPVVESLLAVVERLSAHAEAAAARLQSEVEAARAATEGTARLIQDWGGTEASLQSEHDELTVRVTEARIEQARLQEQEDRIEQELAELRRRHLSPRDLTQADVAGEDAEALRVAVERAARRRERIGPVNPLAEQECAEMEARAGFLAEQRADLEASMARLREVIQELDDHIERTFTDVFAATREHFSSVIASVFPGAKGSLRLTEETPRRRSSAEDGEVTLETEEEERAPAPSGVALEVRLPNKAPRSLSLLSGGEKAMTAIAFLFALFLARPCPFYILDEVEASLDDVNIRRFLSLVRKYGDRTQFIIITHQRQTMEVADTLYGVALESDGTSRVLSRRLTVAKGA